MVALKTVISKYKKQAMKKNNSTYYRLRDS